MGLYPRRGAFYPNTPSRKSILDGSFNGTNRSNTRVSFFGDLVYAQELIPGKVGMISGLFFGFAFGMGGVGSALLGALADRTSIEYVYSICAFLPLIGLITGFLPDIGRKGK